MGAGDDREVTVSCLLLLGDQAELVPDGWDGQGEPASWPSSAIAVEAGLPAAELPGRRFLVRAAERDGGVTFSGFRLLA